VLTQVIDKKCRGSLSETGCDCNHGFKLTQLNAECSQQTYSIKIVEALSLCDSSSRSKYVVLVLGK